MYVCMHMCLYVYVCVCVCVYVFTYKMSINDAGGELAQHIWQHNPFKPILVQTAMGSLPF